MGNPDFSEIAAIDTDSRLQIFPVSSPQCCGSEFERIRKFWLDPNPKKSSDSDTHSDSDTVVA
jgi:hypothetical protein